MAGEHVLYQLILARYCDELGICIDKHQGCRRLLNQSLELILIGLADLCFMFPYHLYHQQKALGIIAIAGNQW